MIRKEVLDAIAAYRAPEVTAMSKEDVDPYRCPECDVSLERVHETTPMGFRCPTHGLVTARYDQRRAYKSASLSFAASDCGCYGDSGPYTVYCDGHDPEELVELLIAEIERLRGEAA